jgi:hypothetical protein
MTSKFSEKILLDNYQYLCKGGSYKSVIDGKEYWWEYRRGDWEDGYNPIVYREHASEITVNVVGYTIATIALDSECDNHPNLVKIAAEEAEAYTAVI